MAIRALDQLPSALTDEYLTLKEAAAQYGGSERTIRNNFPLVRWGSRTLVRKKDFYKTTGGADAK